MDQEAINQLQDVVDVLINFTKVANSVEKVGAALGFEDTITFFDSKTRKLEYKYDAQEEETRKTDVFWSTIQTKTVTSKWAGIFECVKGMVMDNWIRHKEAEEQAKQVLFNRTEVEEQAKQVLINRTEAELRKNKRNEFCSTEQDYLSNI
jgi:hypothetical protein